MIGKLLGPHHRWANKIHWEDCKEAVARKSQVCLDMDRRTAQTIHVEQSSVPKSEGGRTPILRDSKWMLRAVWCEAIYKFQVSAGSRPHWLVVKMCLWRTFALLCLKLWLVWLRNSLDHSTIVSLENSAWLSLFSSWFIHGLNCFSLFNLLLKPAWYMVSQDFESAIILR